MNTPVSELITIGDELLLGRTVNSNAAFLGRRLAECGVPVRWSSCVADDMEEIQAAISLALNRADVIILSGGLGPTPDDLTRDAISQLFDLPFVDSPEQRRHVEDMFRKLGREMPVQSSNQTVVLGGTSRLENPLGTAAGIYLERKSRHLFAVPGVPPEMERMFDDQIEPILRQTFGQAKYFARTLRMAGIGESALLEKLGDLDPLSRRVSLAYLPHQGLLDVRMTSAAQDEMEAEADIAFAEHYIRERVGDHIYATGRDTLSRVIGDILVNRAQWVTTAESCTGGLVASLLTDTPGASRWLARGVITYSNDVKQELLGVKAETLDNHGAVSEETVREMAEGALRTSGANWAVSLSGVAGPDGGTADKPVGTVWIGIASETKTVARKIQVGSRSRELVKLRAAHFALYMLYRELVAH
ncbi:MAG: competence/damage-inducible protein A [Calditrichaeota bacterium]|nr:competence/damage-inducible protein A [Calditrichota bacterium]MCB9367986.1 competence/damage-inducible protein A [Calditrichota bacterium]